MKNLNPALVLDPTWICQAKHVDLEYYTYIMLDAKQKYLKNLDSGFINFYEVVFHYLNLNTIIADKKLYDSYLNVVRSHKNLMMIVSQLTQTDDAAGKEIVKMSSGILREVMHAYLKRQVPVLENLHFHFNANMIHKEEVIYVVCKARVEDYYEIIKLTFSNSAPFGYSASDTISVNLPDLRNSEFRDQLIQKRPELMDFNPSKNVLVVSGTDKIEIIDGFCLAKDTILLNKITNPTHGFDANVMLDYNRLLNKKQAIPYKIKA